MLLAAVAQFKDQTTTRLLITALEDYEDSGATQKEDVKIEDTSQNSTINSK